MAGRNGASPRDLELLAGVVVEDVLEARQLVGDRAHVATTLHVVLSAQRVDAGAVPTDMAAQQVEVDQRQHVVDAVVMFGDAERPTHLGPVCGCEGMGEFADGVGRYARNCLGPFQRPLLDGFTVLVETGCRALDEGAVVETGGDDLATDRVGECDVGADLQPEPAIGPASR